MPLSTFSAFSGITEGAPLSPSYMNAKLSALTMNLVQVNADAGVSAVSLTGWNKGSIATQISMGTFSLSVATGSVMTPAIIFGSDLSFGLYSSGAGQLAMPSGTLMLPTGSAEVPAISFSTYTSRGGIYSSATSVLDIAVGSGGTFAVYSTISASNIYVGATSSNTPAIMLPRGSATTPTIVFVTTAGSLDTTRGIWSSDTSTIDIRAGSGGTVVIQSQLSVSQIYMGVASGNSIALVLPPGSATTPSLSFSTNTSRGGIFSSATSIIDFWVGSGGTIAIHSVLSVTSLFTPIVSSLTTAALSWVTGVFQFAVAASGASLGIRSGNTLYLFNSVSSTSLL